MVKLKIMRLKCKKNGAILMHIDKHGDGAAKFISEAIEIYSSR